MIRYLPIGALAALIIASLGGQAQPQEKPAETTATAPSPQNPLTNFTDFSAVMNGGPSREHDRKIYRSGDLLRLDFPDNYRLTDIEHTVTWSVYADHCIKFPMADVGTLPFHRFKKFNIERSAVHDPETVDGHTCKVETLSFTPKDSGSVGFEMKVWQAEDLKGFPVRMDLHNLATQRTTTYTFTNVSVGPQDAKLFAHPAECGGLSVTDTKADSPKSSKPAAKPAAKSPANPAQQPPQQ